MFILININRMKKIKKIFPIAVAALTLTAVTSGCDPDAPIDRPTFDFASDHTWSFTGELVDGGGTVTQIWSDAVVVFWDHEKTTFDGGYYGEDLKADWIDNPPYGTLFSWKMVADGAENLCPGDWQVPHVVDFIFLDLALCGAVDPYSIREEADEVAKYMDLWGGTLGGAFVRENRGREGQGLHGGYWTLAENDAESAHLFAFEINDVTHSVYPAPVAYNLKSVGFQLRCVKYLY